MSTEPTFDQTWKFLKSLGHEGPYQTAIEMVDVEVDRLRAVYVAAKVYCDLDDASTETMFRKYALQELRESIAAAEKGGE